MGIAMLPNDRLELPPLPDELSLTVPDGQSSIVVEISKVRPGDVIRIRRVAAVESADPRAGCCAETEGFDLPCSAHATRFAPDGRPAG